MVSSCVLVVGSTGSGKSSTISKCTGIPVKTGDGHKGVTRTCQVYKSDKRYILSQRIGRDANAKI